MNYYIADMHFGHKNCLRFDNRPFKDINEMNRVLVENWNTRVKPEDHVWVLGDFCYRSEREPTYFLKQLKGHKHLIIGNHDKATLSSEESLQHFESVEKIKYVQDDGNEIILCHYPIAEWNGKMRGVYHIYGHIHAHESEVYEFMRKSGQAFNAGCMLNGYTPVTFDELVENNVTSR